MKKITIEDLEPLALGSAVLGSGGGGAPNYQLMITKSILEKNGPVTLVDPFELNEEDFVAPIAFMGAPLVALEKIPNGKEYSCLHAKIEKYFSKKITHLIAAEIGGANAFTPIWNASLNGLKVVDGDLIGRAFPEIQMNVCNLHGISMAPTFIADVFGNNLVIDSCFDMTIEKIARQATIAMGSRSLVATCFMQGKTVRQTVVPHTVSLAISIGKAMQNAEDAAESIAEIAKGKILFRGVIDDFNSQIEGGFLKGTVLVKTDCGKVIKIHYQNEFLQVTSEEIVLSVTPDIICLIEQESGIPVTSATLQYGLKVSIVIIPSPSVWKTERGLELVGPGYFGYSKEVLV